MTIRWTPVTDDLASASWRTSSFSSGHGGNCVEVATLRDAAAVRDSKNPDGGILTFAPARWSSFLAATRVGIFEIS
jgi:hypothetical protein